MKKVILSIAVLVGCAITSIAQPCLPSGIYLHYQSQIDSFQYHYPNCTEIEGDVHINGVDINNLWGLINVYEIGGDLEIGDCGGSCNSNLSSLEGLNNLHSIGGNLVIGQYYGSNPLLEDLSGLNGLDSIGGRFKLYENKSLINLNGLDRLSYIGNTFKIEDNPSLINLSGLESLSRIDGSLTILHNDVLRDLTGLQNLTSLGWYIYMTFNDSLRDISALMSLTSINGNIHVAQNESLNSLSGIDNINPLSITSIFAFYNSELSSCHVLSVCEYMGMPNADVSIHDNAPGCNSPEEVLDSCVANSVRINEQVLQDIVMLYPNPFTTFVTIEYELTEPSHIQLTIYNHLGEAVEETVNAFQPPGIHTYTWSAEGLSEGMYFAVLRSGDGVSVVKLIKQ